MNESVLLTCDSTKYTCLTSSQFGTQVIPYNTAMTIPIMPAPAASPFSLSGMVETITTFLSSNLHWLLIILAAIMALQLWNNYQKKNNKIGTLFSVGLFLISMWGVFCYNIWFGAIFAILSILFIVQSENYKFGDEEEEEEEKEPKPFLNDIKPKKQTIFEDEPVISMPSTGISLKLNLF